MRTLSLVILLSWTIAVMAEFKCPIQWHLFGNECLYINDTLRVTWHQARGMCQRMNATLASVTSSDRATFIKERSFRHLWIGLHDLFEEGSFQWLDESPYNYTMWMDGEPNNAAENCVSFDRDRRYVGKWNDHYCNKKLRYICERPADVHGCDRNWIIYSGSCYNFSTTVLSWTDAREACQNDMQADLVAVKSPSINDFLMGVSNYKVYWMGLSDLTSEGTFRWLDSDEQLGWTNWKIKEPNNGVAGLQDCAFMSPLSYTRGRWRAVQCSVNMGYVCEKPRDSVNSSCDDGWVGFQLSCYSTHGNMSTWSDAVELCKHDEAHLVIIGDMMENTFIKSLINVESWIALNDRAGRHVWVWGDETTESTYLNWQNNRGPRSHKFQFDCVFINPFEHNLGKWTNGDCDRKKGYICETATAPGATINVTWVQYGGNYYSFNLVGDSWSKARDHCRQQSNSADLVLIEGTLEQHVINSNIKGQVDLSGFWIGVNSRALRNKFVNLDTNTLAPWLNWGQREPSYTVQESCVEMQPRFTRRFASLTPASWNDQPCNMERGLLCQMPATGNPSYYDTAYNDSLYKMVTPPLTQEKAADYCRDTYGANATLLRIDNDDELEMINAEIRLRFNMRKFNSQIQLWIDGDANSNSSYRKWVKRGLEFAEIRQCISLVPEGEGMWRNRLYSLRMQPKICCEEKMFICEKKIDSESQYDFLFDGATYKILNIPMTQDAANATCLMLMDGAAILVEISSERELDEISKELALRHENPQAEYWVAGDPHDVNLTYKEFSNSPNSGDDCLSLTQSVTNKKDTDVVDLSLTPTTCADIKFAICKRTLYLGGSYEGVYTAAPLDGLVVPEVVEDTSVSPCQGPCKGLAVSLPFIVIITAIVTFFLTTRMKTLRSYRIGFQKANEDEMYLTS